MGLADAQWVVAIEYGFESWPKLKNEIQRLSQSFEEKVKSFIQAAVDGRTGIAQTILAETPDVADANFYSAAVIGNHKKLKDFLEKDPESLSRRGGPKENWDALLYLSNSHLHRINATIAENILISAKLLLENGADPNVFYDHPMWPDSPLRPLYGACGITNNPALATILIDAGAQLNDGESMYHAAENYHLECMELLLERGEDISTPHPLFQNSPLFFLMGWQENRHQWPTVAKGITWLLENGSDPNVPCEKQQETVLHCAVRQRHSVDIIQELFSHGADPNLPRKDGKTPYHLALLEGDTGIINCFKKHGALEPELSETDRFLAACFSGDTGKAQSILKGSPELFSSLTEQERLSLVQAADDNNIAAIKTMLTVGFDITEKGESDWGGTPLHMASWKGNIEAVELLLEHGAPIDIQANEPPEGVPLGWAAHGSKNCANPNGDYVAVVQALVEAGTIAKPYMFSEASNEVRAAIEPILK
ncbi:ankyrin repeat domain-containing protein [Rubellicoccus peritrichatus]|uniref:Ankyrin repeat domain-containing protein n=1 Tax=Rubellicoccus peritrichatus TaxID=3080537 RepID=A0AAQ3QVZ9_9BACT|nr:ankyrin repeat domain-containing protein [Puniceicoccus sp. CR14]WOO41387.1 ankyrin repeat domain-containing protein [Puniceicoccus sp. CR14]